MKVQKNNKYKNKIAAGLSAIIIASTALTGCSESSMIRFNVEVTPEPYEEYVEPGYTAKNESGADITSNVIATNNINNTEFGNYVVKYTITNNSK